MSLDKAGSRNQTPERHMRGGRRRSPQQVQSKTPKSAGLKVGEPTHCFKLNRVFKHLFQDHFRRMQRYSNTTGSSPKATNSPILPQQPPPPPSLAHALDHDNWHPLYHLTKPKSGNRSDLLRERDYQGAFGTCVQRHSSMAPKSCDGAVLVGRHAGG